MTAQDLFNYSLSFIHSMAPTILTVAIVVNVKPLIDLVVSSIGEGGG